jgi:Helix-turn-helix domain
MRESGEKEIDHGPSIPFRGPGGELGHPRRRGTARKLPRSRVTGLPGDCLAVLVGVQKLVPNRFRTNTCRRLADEGTTFKELVDDMRKMVALRTVAGHDVGLSEIALLAGFTETPSFYRAFRRWTGVTPSQYRYTHRGDLRGLR